MQLSPLAPGPASLPANAMMPMPSARVTFAADVPIWTACPCNGMSDRNPNWDSGTLSCVIGLPRAETDAVSLGRPDDELIA